jgi:hypothetical protein
MAIRQITREGDNVTETHGRFDCEHYQNSAYSPIQLTNPHGQILA